MVLRNGPLRRALVCLLTSAALVAHPAAALDAVSVVLDQAKVMKLPPGVSTIIVGNPLIADVSVQSGGLMVLTGKGYGTTNMVVLDRAGGVLVERVIKVEGATDNLVVYRGVDRESYSCSPNCERRITLGDAPGFFDPTLAQAANRSGQAQASSGSK